MHLNGDSPSAPEEKPLTTSLDGDSKAVFTSNSTDKRERQLAYVQRFAKVAQAEMKKYSIPASVKLAQGLLESDAGNRSSRSW